MPLENTHTARQLPPDSCDKIRTQVNAFGEGITVQWCVRAGKPVEAQSIHFDAAKFTADEAKAWLEKHKYSAKEFIPATGTHNKAARGADLEAYSEDQPRDERGRFGEGGGGDGQGKDSGKPADKYSPEQLQRIVEKLKKGEGAIVLKTPKGVAHKIRNKDDLREFLNDGGKLPEGAHASFQWVDLAALGLPTLLRIDAAAGSLELQAAAGDGAARKRAFQATAYTGSAMRLDGYAAPVVIDLAGMKVPAQKFPMLRQHDPERIVGYADAAEISPKRLKLSGQLTGVTPAGQEALALADQGFPWQLSVGADVGTMEFVPKDQMAKCNGMNFDGPCYVARATSLRECSLVPMGADPGTSANIGSAADLQGYSPDQERDDRGRFTDQGSSDAVKRSVKEAEKAAQKVEVPGLKSRTGEASGKAAALSKVAQKKDTEAAHREAAQAHDAAAAEHQKHSSREATGAAHREAAQAHQQAADMHLYRADFLRRQAAQASATIGSAADPDLQATFVHNSKTSDSEPAWGSVDKTALPALAFADHTSDNQSKWGWPHHFVQGGTRKDDQGNWENGTLYLHEGGLKAAWAAAMGARSGSKAPQAVIDHLEAHRKALGWDKEDQSNKG
jgi:hypothetical protein